QTAPRKGTVILYLSDLLHAGPDNRSPHPRRLFSMSIGRQIIAPKLWHAGYSPHPTLTTNPMSLGDLLGASLPEPSRVVNEDLSPKSGRLSGTISVGIDQIVTLHRKGAISICSHAG